MLKKLDFDSQLFNMDVGSVNADDKNEIVSLIDNSHASQFDLIYLFSSTAKEDLSGNAFPGFKLSYSDEKVIFVKDVTNYIQINESEEISINDWVKFDFEELLQLSYASGEYSRFFLDEKIGLINAKNLYKTWLQKSLDFQMADEVFISGGELASGILTVSYDNGVAKVGLVAVAEHCRGQGLGKKLLAHLNNSCFNKEVKKIIIPTQRVNKQACKFYCNAGFNELTSSYIYHYWKSHG